MLQKNCPISPYTKNGHFKYAKFSFSHQNEEKINNNIKDEDLCEKHLLLATRQRTGYESQVNNSEWSGIFGRGNRLEQNTFLSYIAMNKHV